MSKAPVDLGGLVGVGTNGDIIREGTLAALAAEQETDDDVAAEREVGWMPLSGAQRKCLATAHRHFAAIRAQLAQVVLIIVDSAISRGDRQ